MTRLLILLLLLSGSAPAADGGRVACDGEAVGGADTTLVQVYCFGCCAGVYNGLVYVECGDFAGTVEVSLGTFAFAARGVWDDRPCRYTAVEEWE